MMASDKSPVTRMGDLFASSEKRLRRTKKAFNTARSALTNAQIVGTEAQAASQAAARYADALRTHALIVVDYAAESIAPRAVQPPPLIHRPVEKLAGT